MDLVYFGFSVFTPFIYPPGVCSSMTARQYELAKKMFSENSSWCRFWWFGPHHTKSWGKVVAQAESKFEKVSAYRAL